MSDLLLLARFPLYHTSSIYFCFSLRPKESHYRRAHISTTHSLLLPYSLFDTTTITMGNCASSIATDADGKTYEGSECSDSLPSSRKYQSPTLTALRNNNVFRSRQCNRRDMIVASEHIPQDEKEQILTVESKRMRGRLSPFPEDDLTHYREMTFHIPDDDEYFVKPQDPLRSLSGSAASPKARKVVDLITPPIHPLNPVPPQGLADLGDTQLATFVKMSTRDDESGGFGWTLASFSGGATEPDYSANEGMESSLKSSRLGRSASKKKNVSFTAESTTVSVPVTCAPENQKRAC
jgi:hypothetical protein